MVGDVGIGGENPIRIQSMTTSNTKDTQSTVSEIMDLERAGCEIVRLTVPTQKDADNLPNIRAELKKQGSKVPLVADIHFTPAVAMSVVEHVEKVRINPGNFADRKKFAVHEYTDSEYQLELERIAETFSPLVKRCKELGVAMRIGTNHGSLSDRIMNRFGDTPQGMVESALEFIRIAESLSYRDIVVSMKASNPQIMVQAYRQLVSRFMELQMDYPLHLGVTEAGEGKDGRIKSAVGIGSLLEDGLGDTIRVSLTEDAIHEIPVAKAIADRYNNARNSNAPSKSFSYREFRNPFSYQRFYSRRIPLGSLSIGEDNPIRTEVCVPTKELERHLTDLGQIARKNGLDMECIYVREGSDSRVQEFVREEPAFPLSWTHPGVELQTDPPSHKTVLLLPQENIGMNQILDLLEQREAEGLATEISWNPEELDFLPEFLDAIQEVRLESLIFSLQNNANVFSYRKLAFHLSRTDFPILIQGEYSTFDELLYDGSIRTGALLIDGIGDMVRLDCKEISPSECFQFQNDLLQAARVRVVKTEYISCPSCGRTLFNLQDTTARIKKRTAHLKGVKIAIMGCIVNGPGEMADADFGYVGAGPGRVHLYKGKELVVRGVPSEEADERLIDLIKEHGMWRDADTDEVSAIQS